MDRRLRRHGTILVVIVLQATRWSVVGLVSSALELVPKGLAIDRRQRPARIRSSLALDFTTAFAHGIGEYSVKALFTAPSVCQVYKER